MEDSLSVDGGRGVGSGGNASVGKQQMKLRSPAAHLLLTGLGPKPLRGPGVGDPWCTLHFLKNAENALRLKVIDG